MASGKILPKKTDPVEPPKALPAPFESQAAKYKRVFEAMYAELNIDMKARYEICRGDPAKVDRAVDEFIRAVCERAEADPQVVTAQPDKN